jgi:hypothetical protein
MAMWYACSDEVSTIRGIHLIASRSDERGTSAQTSFPAIEDRRVRTVTVPAQAAFMDLTGTAGTLGMAAQVRGASS